MIVQKQDCKSSLFYWYFDICNCICLNTYYDIWLFLYILNSVIYFLLNTRVQTFSIDFILSILIDL